MTKKRYGKLVRDKIPEIIRKDGGVPHVRVMEPDEYRRELCYKLIEEAEEVRKAVDTSKEGIMTELADTLEVVEALMAELGISADDVFALKAKRREDRGIFTQRIFLDSVDQN